MGKSTIATTTSTGKESRLPQDSIRYARLKQELSTAFTNLYVNTKPLTAEDISIDLTAKKYKRVIQSANRLNSLASTLGYSVDRSASAANSTQALSDWNKYAGLYLQNSDQNTMSNAISSAYQLGQCLKKDRLRSRFENDFTHLKSTLTNDSLRHSFERRRENSEGPGYQKLTADLNRFAKAYSKHYSSPSTSSAVDSQGSASTKDLLSTARNTISAINQTSQLSDIDLSSLWTLRDRLREERKNWASSQSGKSERSSDAASSETTAKKIKAVCGEVEALK